MSDEAGGFTAVDLTVAAEAMLDDTQVCKAMLIDALKLADRNENLSALIRQVIVCADTMAQLISLGRAEQAYDLWLSFRSEHEDDADSHS